MKEFFQGIYSRATSSASTLYSKVGTRIYLGEAPQNTALPYIVYGLVDNSKDKNLNTYYEEGTVDFTIYSNSKSVAEVSETYNALKERFDDCTFPVTDYSVINFDRDISYLDKVPDEKPGESLWQYTVQYDYRLRKTT